VSDHPDIAALIADPACAAEVPAEDRQSVRDALAIHDVHYDDQVGYPAAHGNDTRDQPEPVRGVWVCHTCVARPVPTLAAVAASLMPAEREQLQAGAAAGDRLAIQVLGALMLVTCPVCGGGRWGRPAGPNAERCVSCAWSPVSAR
jgi:hypothetical protein